MFQLIPCFVEISHLLLVINCSLNFPIYFMASGNSLRNIFTLRGTASTSSRRRRTRSCSSSMCSRSTILVSIPHNDLPVHPFLLQMLPSSQATSSLSHTYLSTLPTLSSITDNEEQQHPQQLSHFPFYSQISFSSTKSFDEPDDIIDTVLGDTIATSAVVGTAIALPHLIRKQ